ncbi:MAG TPA: DUF2782 domain-containing protein [Methylophaga aminisulfidivorans]|uniref:DUF2782 domain-containing protein n=2 Tax=root TaxID=1 RepID=A0A7C1W4K3_9GAMM|nr:DUF2782 domain-containing protein [Methylophaga aminisulfidivorans]HEC74975.1 DUF2782 domain-containing protein [Methylophaga aminisulfidivorans]
MFNKIAIVSAVGLLMTTQVWAEDSVLVQPPVIPEPLQSGESMEPDINIIQEDDRTVEEYRVNGELYMIKVTPTIGKPYYLMDSDGDGSLETKSFELGSPAVPNWILFKW